MDSHEFEQELGKLFAINTGLLIAIAALIRTHPTYDRMQLELTTVLEKQLGDGVFSGLLSDEQKGQVRELVEWLGSLQPRTAAGPQGSDPLAAILGRLKP